jgi:thymidylate synthase
VRQYLDILRKAMDQGVDRDDRTGTGTRAIFGEVMRFRMRDGFPAVTTKRLAFRSVLAELLWFLAGSSDVNELHALGVRIWDGNAYAPYWIGKARFKGATGSHQTTPTSISWRTSSASSRQTRRAVATS